LKPETPIVIQLKDVSESKRPLLKINQEEVPWDALESRLAAAFKLRVDRVAFIKGDPEVDFNMWRRLWTSRIMQAPTV
jgi:hypothetical protein